MARAPDDDWDQRLGTALARYDECRLDGLAPHEAESSLAELDQTELEAFRALQGTLEVIRKAVAPYPNRQNPTNPSNAGRETTESAHAKEPSRPKTFGRFEIRRELGRGGFGVVFLAWDPKLAREVALKIPSADSIFSETLKRRFLREAQAAARLRHPNIVTVFETSEVGPTAYIASEYHDGPNLAQWRRQRASGGRGENEPLDPRLAATLVGQLADAVEHAHQQKVLHRDLKPSNVPVTRKSGSPPPNSGTAPAPPAPAPARDPSPASDLVLRLTDFGLAKLADVEGDETRTGAVVGTPRYMSPEQADGSGRAVGPGTDIHALGVMLYELLTGRPPYVGETDIAVLTAICQEEPIAPRRLRPNVPSELETICLKCLEKQPEKRYPSAGALAEDLRRFLAGEPILARPAGPVERLVKWTRRRPLVAALAGLGAAFFLTVLGISLWANSRQALANRQIDRERQRADDQAHITKANLYVADLVLAQQALDRGSVDEARSILEPFIDTDPKRDLRTFEWYHLWHRLGEQSGSEANEVPELSWQTEDTHLETVALSPDGTVVAAEGTPGRIDLVDASSGGRRGSIAAHSAVIVDLAYSPDGTELYSVSDDTTVAISDPDSMTVIERLEEHADEVYAVAVSPDGKYFATGGLDCQLILWDSATRKPVWRNKVHTDAVKCLSFSQDGKRLASGSSDRTARVWDVADGREVDKFDGHTQLIHGVAFLPDDRLVTASYDRELRFWDSKTGACQSSTHCEDQLSSVVLDRARSLVAVGSLAGPLRAVGTDGVLQTLRLATKGLVADLALARDGTRLVVGYRDGAIEILPGDVLLGRPPRIVQAGVGSFVGFLRDNRCVMATNDSRGNSFVLDLVSSRLTLGLQSPNRISTMAVRPRTDEVALGYHKRPHHDDLGRLWWQSRRSGLPESLQLWNAAALGMTPDDCRIESMDWTPDGASLAAGTSTGKLVVWDRERQEVDWIKQAHAAGLVLVACSHDGKLIATTFIDGSEVRIWNRASGDLIHSFDSDGRNMACRFSPAQDLLLIGDRSGGITGWETPTWSWLNSAKPMNERIYDLEFSPDGKYLALGGPDQLSLVKVATLDTIWRSEKLRGPVESVLFSSDGRWLGAGCRNNHSTVLDLRGIRCRDPYTVPEESLARGLSLAPDGRRLVTGAEAGDGLVLDLETESVIRRVPKSHVATQFLPDGKRIATYVKEPPTLRLLDAQSFQVLGEIRDEFPSNGLLTLAISNDCRWAAVSRSVEQDISVFDLAAGKFARRIASMPRSDLWSAVFSPDAQLLFCVGGNSRIDCWNVPEFQLLWSTTLRADSLARSPIVSPDGAFVAVSTDSGQHATIEILRSTDGKRLFQLIDSEMASYQALAFSRDGKTLAAISSGNDAIRCWNLLTRRPSVLLNTQAGATEPALAFLPQDRALVVLGGRLDRHGAAVKLFRCAGRQASP